MLIQSGLVVGKNNYTSPISLVNNNPKNIDVDLVIHETLSLTPSTKDVLNTLIGCDNRHQIIQISYETIRRKVGCSKKTAQRAVADLVAKDFLFKDHTEGGSNRYRLTEVFDDAEVRESLKQILSALNYTRRYDNEFSYGKCPRYYKNNIYIRETRIGFEAAKARTQWVSLEEVCRFRESGLCLPMADVVLCSKREKNPKKESVVSDFAKESATSNVVPHYIKAITELELGHAQQLELIGFSEKTIVYARAQIRNRTDISHPFLFFKGICKKHSTQSPSFSKPSHNTTTSGKVATNAERTRSLDNWCSQSEKRKQDVKESWRSKSLTELAELKAAGLNNIKDPDLQRMMATLFDNCMTNAYGSQPIVNEAGNGTGIIPTSSPKRDTPRELFTETLENTTLIRDIEDQSDDFYEEVNTNLFFD